MAVTAQTEAELAAWLDTYTQVLEELKTQAAEAAEAAWMSFGGWYETAAVMALAAELADASTAAQQTAAGIAAQYVETLLAVLDIRVPAVAAPKLQPVRNGADLKLVHSRPAETFRRAIATGGEDTEAADLAIQRGSGLMRTDLSLVTRETERSYYAEAGIKGYRRVVRPELSKSGSCGLCIVASNQVYKSDDLMPIHPPWCKCTTMPILGEDDPGRRLNDADLKAMYAAAGSTSTEDLTNVRVQVNEHGEFGPVLTRKGDGFRSASRVALEDDPARAARMLTQTRPVLEQLEQRATAGEDVAGPLAYQRGLIARLERIAA